MLKKYNEVLLFVVLSLIVGWVVCTILFEFIGSIICSLFIVILIQSILKRIEQKIGYHIVCRVMLCLGIYFIVFLLFGLLVNEIVNLIQLNYDFIISIFNEFILLSSQYENTILSSFVVEVSTFIKIVFDMLFEYLLTFIVRVPSLFFECFFIVFSSLLFLFDYYKIKSFILEIDCFILDKCISYVYLFKKVIKEMISFMFIMALIHYVVIAIGLFVLGFNQWMMIALWIAFFDLMPLIGMDFIFIPWVSYLFMIKDTKLAIGLVVLYFVLIIIKQFLEPKILGGTSNIHPLGIVVCFYIAFKLFGFIGMIICYVMFFVIKVIYRVS